MKIQREDLQVTRYTARDFETGALRWGTQIIHIPTGEMTTCHDAVSYRRQHFRAALALGRLLRASDG